MGAPPRQRRGVHLRSSAALKRALKDRQERSVYHEIASDLDIVIAKKLRLSVRSEGSADRDLVDAADNWALHVEALALLKNGVVGLGGKRDLSQEEVAELPALEDPQPPATAERVFLDRHASLTGLVP